MRIFTLTRPFNMPKNDPKYAFLISNTYSNNIHMGDFHFYQSTFPFTRERVLNDNLIKWLFGLFVWLVVFSYACEAFRDWSQSKYSTLDGALALIMQTPVRQRGWVNTWAWKTPLRLNTANLCKKVFVTGDQKHTNKQKKSFDIDVWAAHFWKDSICCTHTKKNLTPAHFYMRTCSMIKPPSSHGINSFFLPLNPP